MPLAGYARLAENLFNLHSGNGYGTIYLLSQFPQLYSLSSPPHPSLFPQTVMKTLASTSSCRGQTCSPVMSGTLSLFSIICLFSQLRWLSLCQQLWGFALAWGGTQRREDSLLGCRSFSRRRADNIYTPVTLKNAVIFVIRDKQGVLCERTCKK